MLLKKVFKPDKRNISFIKLDHSILKNGTYKNNSKVYLNTDTYSANSQKIKIQQGLIKKIRDNIITSEDNVDNTKISSIFIKKYKENISKLNNE